MLFFLPWITGMLLAGAHWFVRRATLDRLAGLELVFRYQLIFCLAFSGFLGFMGHGLRPEQTAAAIGWPAHPQFQFELAAFELGYAVAAVLGLWIRNRSYWLGISLAPSVFTTLAAVLHVQEIAKKGNFAPNNVIVILPDLLLPATLLGLLWLIAREDRRRRPAARA